MKNISKNLPVHLESVLLLVILITVLLFSPLIYNSFVPRFALLDQSVLFNTFILIGLIGLIVYVVSNSKRVLGISYPVSAFILGVSGYAIWPRLINIPENTYLILGVLCLSFVVFRRGLNIDISGSKKSLIKYIIIGVVLGIFSFIFTNFLLKSLFPNFDQVLVYGLSSLLLILGSHLKGIALHKMDVLKFSFDMSVLVILYNFILFSSRINIGSLLQIGKHNEFFTLAFTSSVYGILVGLIGAYLLHRHHLSWKQETIKNEQNFYFVGLLSGILALSFLVGANPFISAAVMGFLVTMRDSQDNPENHILSYIESYLGIFVFLILGSAISFSILGMLFAFSSGVVVLISLVLVLVLSFVLFIFSKFHLLPEAKYITYLAEVLNRQSVSVFIGALTLFIISSGFNNLFITTCFVVILCVFYIYPIFIKHLKN